MFDPETLQRLSSQPVGDLVRALERLHSERRDLPAELRPVIEASHPPAEAAPVPTPPVNEAAPAAATGTDLASGLRSLLAEYEGSLRRYNEDFDRLFQQQQRSQPPALVDTELSYGSAGPHAEDAEAAIVERLKRAQLLLFKFPIAAQAAFAAFVEEGRQYARTEEGRRWTQALAGSPLLDQVSRTLSSLSLGALREAPSTLLPSALVDLLVSAASHPELQRLLEQATAKERP